MEAEETMEGLQEFPEHHKMILDRLNEQREQDRFTDITLIVDGGCRKAAPRSPRRLSFSPPPPGPLPGFGSVRFRGAPGACQWPRRHRRVLLKLDSLFTSGRLDRRSRKFPSARTWGGGYKEGNPRER